MGVQGCNICTQWVYMSVQCVYTSVLTYQKDATCFLYMSHMRVFLIGNRAKRPGSGRHIDSTKTDECSLRCCFPCSCSSLSVFVSVVVSVGNGFMGSADDAYGVSISTAYDDDDGGVDILLLLVVSMGSLDVDSGMVVCDVG